jgi:hypothetical protein
MLDGADERDAWKRGVNEVGEGRIVWRVREARWPLGIFFLRGDLPPTRRSRCLFGFSAGRARGKLFRCNR